MAWHCKATGQYDQGSTECTENAQEIYSYLSAKGWTLNAIAGLLGNLWPESGLNPWRWQSDVVQPTTNSPWWSIGYGLAQFTQAGTYINLPAAKAQPEYGPNFSNRAGKTTDGIAQLYVIDTDARGGYIRTNDYNMTFSMFKKSTASPSYLAVVWLANYERPASITDEVKKYRGGIADYFYELLSGSTPEPPEPTPGTDEHHVYVGHSGLGNAYPSINDTTSGTRVRLFIEPADGWHEDGFRVVSGDVDIEENDGIYSFIMPDSDVIIFGVLLPDEPTETHYVTVLSVGNGTAYAQPTSGELGTNVFLRATPSDEVTGFEKWEAYSGGVNIVSPNLQNTSFIMQSGDVFVIAYFGGEPAPVSYTVTIVVKGVGWAEAIPSVATAGATIILNAGTDRKHKFVKWTGLDAIEGIVSDSTAFTMPAHDVIIYAWFKRSTNVSMYIPWWRKYGL